MGRNQQIRFASSVLVPNLTGEQQKFCWAFGVEHQQQPNRSLSLYAITLLYHKPYVGTNNDKQNATENSFIQHTSAAQYCDGFAFTASLDKKWRENWDMGRGKMAQQRP